MHVICVPQLNILNYGIRFEQATIMDGAGCGDVAPATVSSGLFRNGRVSEKNLTGLMDSSIDLNFTGTDAGGALSLNGGSTFLSPETYSTSDLNTAYGSNVFTGAGQLQVVPEPTSAALLLLAGGVLAYLNRQGIIDRGLEDLCP